jgi:hypothetical protein
MSAVAVSVSSDTKAQSENEDVSCQELDVAYGDHRRTPHTYVVSVPKSHVINWQNVLWIRGSYLHCYLRDVTENMTGESQSRVTP